VIDRALGKTGAQETLVGWVPREGDLDLSGLDIKSDAFRAATDIKLDEWISEIDSQKEFFDQVGTTMPEPLLLQRELLRSALAVARARPSGASILPPAGA